MVRVTCFPIHWVSEVMCKPGRGASTSLGGGSGRMWSTTREVAGGARVEGVVYATVAGVAVVGQWAGCSRVVRMVLVGDWYVSRRSLDQWGKKLFSMIIFKQYLL